MSDDDLIRRGDALECFMGYDRTGDIKDAIAALPAVTQPAPAAMTPEVRALVEERDRLKEALYIDDLTVTLQGEDRARLIDRNKNLEAALRKGEALKYVLCDIQDRDTYLSRRAFDALKSFCDALAALRAGETE